MSHEPCRTVWDDTSASTRRARLPCWHGESSLYLFLSNTHTGSYCQFDNDHSSFQTPFLRMDIPNNSFRLEAVCPGDTAQPAGTRLDRTLLRLSINGNQAEGWTIPYLPLEVVHS